MADLGNVAQIASAVISLAALVTALWAARSKRHETALNNIREDMGRCFSRVDRCEQRVTGLETELRHVPGKEDVHELKLAMVELKGQMDVLIERVGPIKKIAERMQESLVEHGK